MPYLAVKALADAPPEVLSILYLRCAAVGFHDMADPLVSFNSLFEMQNAVKHTARKNEKFWLSILYLRCPRRRI